VEKIAFDDIAAIEKHISEEYGPWGQTYEVTQEKIQAFAELTGDHQWIHIDVERCKKESPFGGPIAHGFLTLSLLPFLAAGGEEPFVLTGAANVVNYGADGLRFVMPVPAGATVHARRRLKGVEAVKKGTRILQEVVVHVVGEEKPAIVYDMITLYQAPR
jgi:acyl dehydratase